MFSGYIYDRCFLQDQLTLKPSYQRYNCKNDEWQNADTQIQNTCRTKYHTTLFQRVLNSLFEEQMHSGTFVQHINVDVSVKNDETLL